MWCLPFALFEEQQAAAARCSSKSSACAVKKHGRWLYCYDALAAAFWKIRR
jgi:hypothetical protein